MDLQVKYKRYLGVFGTPADAICWQTMTLRTGYVMVGLVDMILAVMSLWELVLVLWSWEGMGRYQVETALSDLFAILAFPFAVSGLLGLPNFDLWKVSAYSYFKHIELLLLCLFYPFALQDLCYAGSLGCDNYTLALLWVIRAMCNFYATYIVWSVDMRMRVNQLVVIQHGPEVAKSIQSPISSN